MKKLISTITISMMAVTGVAATATVSGASTASTPQATATTIPGIPNPPIQTRHHKALILYVDTVQGSGGVPKAAVSCAMTNLFVKGQVVVFRMWGNDVTTGGGALTDKTVASALVTVPGVATPITLAYGAHGTYPNKVAYWTGAWPTAGSSVGVVNFVVTVTTKAVPKTRHHAKIPAQTGTFTQAGTPASSMLTVT